MATDLSKSEKEDREAERLIDKKPAPSRKRAPRRGPKFDNRRRRVKVDDADMKMSTAGKAAVWKLALELGAASNESASDRTMPARTATYHGVLEKGHPTDSTDAPVRSYDKRYFGQKHFDSILKTAKGLLKEDWLKYGWDDGAGDVQFRAALDLAIHTADNCLYQSKVDSETYDMLLNRLAGWDHDTFSETVLPYKEGSNRSASSMSSIDNIVRIANDLRHRDPVAALEILKNLRSLTAGDVPEFLKKKDDAGEGSPEGDVAQAAPMGPPMGPPAEDDAPEETTAMGPGDKLEFKSLGDDDFKKIKEDAKKVFESEDIESFLKGFDEIHKGLKKVGAFVDSSVELTELVRIAHAFPQTREALLPVIVAAKKKSEKKDKKKDKSASPDKSKDAKKAPKGKDEEKPAKGKKPPFPPAKGKKPAPKGRKASVEISSVDAEW